jgi:hypothetical protein
VGKFAAAVLLVTAAFLGGVVAPSSGADPVAGPPATDKPVNLSAAGMVDPFNSRRSAQVSPNVRFHVRGIPWHSD